MSEPKYKYVIRCPYPSDTLGFCCYFVGEDDYTFQGERYKVVTEMQSEAKGYTSYNRARCAAEGMVGRYVNIPSNYDIVAVLDPNGEGGTTV